MDEPWQIYYEELHDRGADIPAREWNREGDLAEVTHEAYQATADRLLNHLDYTEEEALSLTRRFGQTVKDWIEEGEFSWEDLQEALEAAQIEWEQGRERSTL